MSSSSSFPPPSSPSSYPPSTETIAHYAAINDSNQKYNHQSDPFDFSYLRNPTDGSIVLDHNEKPLSIAKLLASQPLRHELSSRPGPGGKKLTYLSGDAVSRTLNDIFGYQGWNLEIQHCDRVVLQEPASTSRNNNSHSSNSHQKHTVVYTSQVRVTHTRSGCYKEDVGSGEATDKNFATAVSNALKASVTDAMKRAARHFGEKLGNCLYSDGFSINKAPTSLKDALDKFDIDRAKTKFGFPKQKMATASEGNHHRNNNSSASSSISVPTPPTTTSSSTTTVPPLPSASQKYLPQQPTKSSSSSLYRPPPQQQPNPPNGNVANGSKPHSNHLPPGGYGTNRSVPHAALPQQQQQQQQQTVIPKAASAGPPPPTPCQGLQQSALFAGTSPTEDDHDVDGNESQGAGTARFLDGLDLAMTSSSSSHGHLSRPVSAHGRRGPPPPRVSLDGTSTGNSGSGSHHANHHLTVVTPHPQQMPHTNGQKRPPLTHQAPYNNNGNGSNGSSHNSNKTLKPNHSSTPATSTTAATTTTIIPCGSGGNSHNNHNVNPYWKPR